MAITNALFSLPPQIGYLKSLRSQFDDLQRQLATDKKAQTYGQLGSTNSLDLLLRQQKSDIGVYKQSIDLANLRLRTLDQTSTHLEGLAIDAKAAVDPNNFKEFPNGRAESQISTEIALRDFLAQLNTNVGGRYLFSGKAADRIPVAELDYILQGDATYAGFRQVSREYNQADLGADGKGRLKISESLDASQNPAVSTVSLSEDAIAGAHPFGFKLFNAQSTLSNVTVFNGKVAVPTTVQGAALNAADLGYGFIGGTLTIGGKTITLADGIVGVANGTGAPAANQGTGVDTPAKIQALDGRSITLTAADGITRTFDFTVAKTPADLKAELEANSSGFTIDTSNPDGLQITRADGQAFTITTSHVDVDAAIGFAGSVGPGVTINNGQVDNNVTAASLAAEITAKFNSPTDTGITARAEGGALIISKADGTDLTISGDAALLGKLRLPVGGDGNVTATNGIEAADGVRQFDFRFDGQPEPGEVIRLFFDLPDGTRSEIRIGAEGPTQENPQFTFAIGATAAETAANFKAVLGTALEKAGRTELLAASTVRASENFFDTAAKAGGQPTGPLRVVQGITQTAGFNTFQFADAGLTFDAIAGKISLDLTIDEAPAQAITITEADVVSAGGDAVVNDINEFTSILAAKLGGGVTVTNDGLAITIQSNTTGAKSSVRIANLVADADGNGSPDALTLGLANGAGTPGQVISTGLANATSFVSNPNDTVAWYQGENGADPARLTTGTKVDDNLTLNYGARANEKAYREVVQSLAAFVTADFSSAQSDNKEFYQALADRVKGSLSKTENGVSAISQNHIEFAAAFRAADDAGNRHRVAEATIDTAVGDIEGINREEVAIRLLQLQTTLEASYQSTRIAFQLTLANYI